jgi:hypothetical protein
MLVSVSKTTKTVETQINLGAIGMKEILGTGIFHEITNVSAVHEVDLIALRGTERRMFINLLILLRGITVAMNSSQ